MRISASNLERSISGVGCRTDRECALDLAGGRCQLIDESKAPTLPPIVEQGPFCECDQDTTRCRFRWSEPVECTTWRDCGWERGSRLRPVPADPPRTESVEPCVDQEFDSRCIPEGEAGTCHLMFWGC